MKDASETPEQCESERTLFPELPPAEREQAVQNFDDFLALMLRIYERIRRDPEAWANYQRLTAKDTDAAMEEQRSKTN